MKSVSFLHPFHAVFTDHSRSATRRQILPEVHLTLSVIQPFSGGRLEVSLALVHKPFIYAVVKDLILQNLQHCFQLHCEIGFSVFDSSESSVRH